MTNGFLPTEAEQPKSVPEALPAEPQEEVSSVEADRQTFEQLAESRDNFLETAAEAPTTAVAAEGAPGQAAAAPAPVPKDEVVLEVEKILEEGLGDYFQEMPPEAKTRFQKKGEEAVVQIAAMVHGFRVKVKKVILLIRDWLLTIPGVNKFFLEQEAKIKTDKILELERVRREEAQKVP